ncbi:hypothetical protein K1T71_013498 [Dendrolimus kikuchii]|uniref:Uncharacterized protein n=1 Tax=Dendrolimus kikuchii TaxID=765133 RepID=A0ACC1CGM6_9NEOP|nr:hypothetical protein K1T71_013498 [Dendrolimus kikuchii]
MFCNKLNSLRTQILIACCLYIGFLADGYSVGWTAPVIVKLQEPSETPLPDVISDTAGFWLASIPFFGASGACLAGFFSNIIGRKFCLIIGAILMIVSYIIITFATNIIVMYFGRFLAGFGQCFTMVLSLVYIGEISSPGIRGTLLSLTGVCHNLGTILVYCVGPFTSYRRLNYVSVGITAVYIFACCSIPESPVYYILKEKVEAAKSCLCYLGREKDIDVELNKMIMNMQQKESKRILWRQLLFKKSNRNALYITVAMYFFQMNSGISFFLLFATKIFKDAGSTIEPYVATIIIGVTLAIGSFQSPIFIDRFGRRLLLIISTSGCCICMTIMGIYLYLAQYNNSAIDELGWLPLFAMIAAFISYGLGLNSVPHTLTSEMYSPKVRGIGSSVSLSSAWISGFISTIVSSYLMIYLGGHFTFWLFSIVNAVALAFVVLFVPETTGKMFYSIGVGFQLLIKINMRLEERTVSVVHNGTREVASDENNELQEILRKLDSSIDKINTCNNEVEALRKENNDDDIEKFNSNNHKEHSSFLTKLEIQSSGKSNNGFLKLEMLYQNFRKFRIQILISCCVYISFLLEGYNVGWTAPVIVKLQNSTESPLADIISDTTGSWLASMIFFGVIGFNLAGFLSNIIGRKPCLIIGGIILTCSYLILIFSTNISMMYFGRFVIGVGQSLNVVVCLIYIAEISSPRIRGTLMTLTGVFHNIGALAVYCIGPFTSYQGLNYVMLAIIPVFILLCFFIPESPTYYILKGKVEAAKWCLNYLNRSKEIDIELNKIIFNMQQKESNIILWRQLFKKSNRLALFITVAMYFFQMNSGITFFMFFATKIFKDAGSSIEPYLATIIIGLTSLLGSLIVPISIERFGRKTLLIISTGGCSICMTIMGIYFYLDKYHHSLISDLGWLPLLTMMSAFVSYGAGLNNIPHTLTGELYSTKVRGLGSSISCFSLSISVFYSSSTCLLCVSVGFHLLVDYIRISNEATLSKMESDLKCKVVSNEDERPDENIHKLIDPAAIKEGSMIKKDLLNEEISLKTEEEYNDDIEKCNHNNSNIIGEYSRFLKAASHTKSNRGALKLGIFCSKLISLRRQIFICCCSYIGFISDGYSVGWSAPVIIKLQDPAETPLPYMISDTASSWLAAIILTGVVGSYPAGFLSNIIGRKPCLIIGGILMIIAYIIVTISTDLTTMYFGRFLTGFSESFSIVVRLLYIGEISSPEIRGTLLSLVGVFHNIGALVVYCVGPFTSYQELNYLSICFAAIFIFACCFVPETHVYYTLKGKDEKAKSCLKYLKRSNEIDVELNRMIFKIKQNESKKHLWRQLLFKNSNRKALFITISMYFFQMNSGINFFMLFATKIFKTVESSMEPYVATIIIGLTSVSGSLLAPTFIDRFGRRLLLSISTGGVSICMMIMGTYFYIEKYHHSSISELGWLPLVTMITAFIFYNVGLNSIPHTLTSEMYSTKVRGLGTSVSYISAWISGLFCLTVSSYLMIYLGSHFTFWLFAIVNGVAFVFGILVVPETTGKTLTEIDDMMAD